MGNEEGGKGGERKEGEERKSPSWSSQDLGSTAYILFTNTVCMLETITLE